MVIGVLALQGGVEEHLAILADLGVAGRKVRLPKDLDGLDGIILPGGESSVIDKLARNFGLAEPLANAIRGGLPTLATCAGLIYCARDIDNPSLGQQTLGVLDISVRRNAFGSQRHSREAEVMGMQASFIRAPLVTRVGDGVEVIAKVDGGVVGVRAEHITAVSFHPEENGETGLHEAWLAALKTQR